MSKPPIELTICCVVTAISSLLCLPADVRSQNAASPGRSQQQIMQERAILEFKIYQLIGDGNPGAGSSPFALTSGKIFSTAQSRRAAGTAIIPAINRTLELSAEHEPLASVEEREANAHDAIFLSTLKIAFGDSKTTDAVRKSAAGAGGDAALAKSILAAADYLVAGQDAFAQSAAIDRLQEAYQNVDPSAPLRSVPMIFSKNPPASEVVEHLLTFLRSDTHSRLSKGIADSIERRSTAAAMLNQPLVIESTLTDGSAFSTAQWKGKVVLVDFWTTTCSPCIRELAEIKRFYPQLHRKGLEVVSYSCDESVEPVKTFLAKNRGMAWSQIFDTAHPGWDAAQKKFGLEAAPATLLIDRKGVLRRVLTGADENLAGQIGKLLAEPP